MNPLTVRLYVVNTSKVLINFTDMFCTTGPTGGQPARIFNKIDSALTKYETHWGNCAWFSLNNTIANLDNRNSVKTRTLAMSREWYLVCPYHVMHVPKLLAWTWWNFTKICNIILIKSWKRKCILLIYVQLCDQEHWQILKHVSVK